MADYDEIDKGRLTAGVHTLQLGATSDRAIGRFDARTPRDAEFEASSEGTTVRTDDTGGGSRGEAIRFCSELSRSTVWNQRS